ncbi:hypothetical protein LOAG_17156 [Loa loa]|uniref:Uncharacterized protein n=1 Tax=Loa loa TaxID=7209 RepID=A0A1S0UJ82_LOALO|nr:hypothetical protein LOAG_17156 [Loa loa]EJD75772.1 hypothetical protein LOAG_17156 [Loa loa]
MTTVRMRARALVLRLGIGRSSHSTRSKGEGGLNFKKSPKAWDNSEDFIVGSILLVE